MGEELQMARSEEEGQPVLLSIISMSLYHRFIAESLDAQNRLSSLHLVITVVAFLSIYCSFTAR
ncbi:unnamed protein product [marine sediment metagenome]|uniref:Uncharacterized protein n=1 Tax=marine sediment metagenome TaxID=412755 RepID=X1HR79_9ZZZZ